MSIECNHDWDAGVTRDTVNKRLALVTGASSGIGEAYADRLAHDGWDLILVGRREDRLKEVARRAGAAGVTAEVVVADLADAAAIERTEAICRQRPLELLINNAGLAHYMPFADLDRARLAELVQVNVAAPTRLTHAALQPMLACGRGTVINVASLLAFSEGVDMARPQRAVYAATKAYILALTRILALELAGTGVRAMVVCPGTVATEFHARQGIDMSGAERMAPDAVVEATFRALELGEVVCMPSVEDAQPLGERDAAAARLLAYSRTTALPRRYQAEQHERVR